MIGFFVPQSAQCLVFGYNTRKEQIYRVKHLIVGNASRHSIIMFSPLPSPAAHADIIKPFFIISSKKLDDEVA